MTQHQLIETRDVIYATPTGGPLGMDFFRLPGTEALPVIMLLHGGGWCLGARQSLDDHARLFAADGYLAVTVSYRLAPAFPYPAACEDLTAAGAWLVAHAGEYGGDGTRLGAYGGSAGAHLAAWLATAPATPLACAVAWAGPTDMRREPVTPPNRSYPLTFMGACTHDAPQAYSDASPLLRMTATMPPLLLIHGTVDDVVSADQARWMVAAARPLGAPVEMLLLDGVNHTGGTPHDPLQAPGWQAMMEFYARHLR
jgi:acetyl esterase/lipase